MNVLGRALSRWLWAAAWQLAKGVESQPRAGGGVWRGAEPDRGQTGGTRCQSQLPPCSLYGLGQGAGLPPAQLDREVWPGLPPGPGCRAGHVRKRPVGGQILPWKVAAPIPHDPVARPRLQPLLVTSTATVSSQKTRPLLGLAPPTAPPCFPRVQLVPDTGLHGGAKTIQLPQKPGVGEFLTGHKSTNSKRKKSTHWPLENFRVAKESLKNMKRTSHRQREKMCPTYIR